MKYNLTTFCNLEKLRLKNSKHWINWADIASSLVSVGIFVINNPYINPKLITSVVLLILLIHWPLNINNLFLFYIGFVWDFFAALCSLYCVNRDKNRRSDERTQTWLLWWTLQKMWVSFLWWLEMDSLETNTSL